MGPSPKENSEKIILFSTHQGQTKYENLTKNLSISEPQKDENEKCLTPHYKLQTWKLTKNEI
jgi:hypothetical protein